MERLPQNNLSVLNSETRSVEDTGDPDISVHVNIRQMLNP
jgi:hypothetical protein